jgi:hypothetical protein
MISRVVSLQALPETFDRLLGRHAEAKVRIAP